MNQPKVEPGADFRAMAHFIRQMHAALMDEGFTEVQTNKIVAEMLTSMGRPNAE